MIVIPLHGSIAYCDSISYTEAHVEEVLKSLISKCLGSKCLCFLQWLCASSGIGVETLIYAYIFTYKLMQGPQNIFIVKILLRFICKSNLDILLFWVSNVDILLI